MKKLGFLLLALTAPVALANPQAGITTSIATAGADVSWTQELAEKNANAKQLKQLNNNSLTIGDMVNKDLDEKIAARLRLQAQVQ
ncbi:hypothetical protein [Simiduia agarivorans]|uniref:Uncharacterized protein n=1 Tax=Simiduia agarivorans (strain DSM 21679 / JCM 13881 / BCRC 17597 / SA1) TaxID=1117647 RepID=K4KN24_SIMAS|nr:hypothetical protein [Simiduia agarivorans]AFU99503.1 hypothetical protein M5M_11630 [Simiduia agarivorans SA1 = DSM 21679]